MKTARLLIDIGRAWLDVRLLRWADRNQPEFRKFHGEKPRLTGYRRRRDPVRKP